MKADMSQIFLEHSLISMFFAGLTLTFRIKIMAYHEDMYIFSNGGEREDAYGVAMLYKLGQIQVIVKTKTLQWITSFIPPPANR